MYSSSFQRFQKAYFSSVVFLCMFIIYLHILSYFIIVVNTMEPPLICIKQLNGIGKYLAACGLDEEHF